MRRQPRAVRVTERRVRPLFLTLEACESDRRECHTRQAIASRLAHLRGWWDVYGPDGIEARRHPGDTYTPLQDRVQARIEDLERRLAEIDRAC